jgi:hypothetical protein
MMLAMIGGAELAMTWRARLLGTPTPVPRFGLAPMTIGVVGAACLVATSINPDGLRSVWFPLTMERAWVRALGAEWQSPLVSSDWGLLIPLLLFWAELGLALIAWARRWRTADLVPAAVALIWLAMSLWHLRAVPAAVLLTMPFICATASRWRDRVERRRGPAPLGDRSQPWSGGVAIVLLGALVWWTLGWVHRDLGFRWDRWTAICAGAPVRRLGLSGRVRAPIEVGNWLRRYNLIWRGTM